MPLCHRDGEYKMRDVKELWDFPVKEGVIFPDANRVHPLMQERVERIYRAARMDENLSRLVLYGSSLEFRCSSASDIDLYAESVDPDQPLDFLPDLDCEVDLVTNLPHDSRLYREIDRTGLLLYEKQQT